MIRMLSGIVAVFLLAGNAFAQISVVQNPSPQTSFVEASAKLDAGQSVTWFIVPEPTKQVEIDNIVYFNGPAGTYSVTSLVQTVKDGKVVNKKTNVKVTIGSAPPVPPVDPVIPPGPGPVIDPFVTAIQVAFTAEAAADKSTSAAKLASIYRMAAKNTVNDATISTMAQLFATMKTASESLLPATSIPGVRKVIGTRLNPVFVNGTTLDAATRAKLVAEFNAVADALSAAK